MPEDLTPNITESAKAPAEFEADGVKAKAHPLPDQIEADRYLASKAAMSTRRRGVRLSRMIHPGPV